MRSLEPRFDQDLNGDGIVGLDVAAAAKRWNFEAVTAADSSPLEPLGGIVVNVVDSHDEAASADNPVDIAATALRALDALAAATNQESQFFF